MLLCAISMVVALMAVLPSIGVVVVVAVLVVPSTIGCRLVGRVEELKCSLSAAQSSGEMCR